VKRVVLICILVIGVPAVVHAASILTGAFMHEDQARGEPGFIFTHVQITQKITQSSGGYDLLFPSLSSGYGFEAQSFEKGAYLLTDPLWAYGPHWNRLLPAEERPRSGVRALPQPSSKPISIAVFGALLVCSGVLLKRTVAIPPQQEPVRIPFPHTPSWKVVRLEDRIRVAPSPYHASRVVREKRAPLGASTGALRA